MGGIGPHDAFCVCWVGQLAVAGRHRVGEFIGRARSDRYAGPTHLKERFGRRIYFGPAAARTELVATVMTEGVSTFGTPENHQCRFYT